MKKLSVIKSAREVFSGVTRHYFELLRAAPAASVAYMLGLVVIGCITAVPSDLSPKDASDARLAALLAIWPLAVVAGFLVLAGFIAAAVRWHRFVLLGEDGGPIWGRFEARYLWTIVKLTLFCFLLIAFILVVVGFAFLIAEVGGELANGVVGRGIFFCVIASLYIGLFAWFIRVSIAFPDAALGNAGSLGTAWDRTAGNGWLLVGYSFVVQFPLSLAVGLLQTALAGAAAALMGDPLAKLVVAVLMLPVSLYVAMIGITMLSIAYREIVGLPGVAGAETLPDPALPA